MLSRSDDEYRNFQNYTRLLDDRNNYIKPNGIDQYENPDLNAYMLQDPYVMNPEGAAEEYAALNINNPAELAYGCKLPEGYNPLAVENINENFPNKINWPQGPNPFLMHDEFNQFDPYNSYFNNIYEAQTFDRNIEDVPLPPPSLFDNSLPFDPQLNFNNYYANDPGYYCPNPMDYPQGAFPHNPLINPRSLALAAQNPQIPPGVDPIPANSFNQALDNIPSSAPIPLSKYSKLSKNPALNSPFVMPPLHGSGISQHYRLPNHPSQKYFHFVNGGRIPQNIKDMYKKAGSSSLVGDVVTTNPLTGGETLTTDTTVGNARNFAVPSTSAENSKSLSSKPDSIVNKSDKDESEKSIKTITPIKNEINIKKEESLTLKDTANVITTDTTVPIKTKIDTSKMDIDVKATPLKQEEVKKEEANINASIKTIDSAKTVINTPVETKIINTQINATKPSISTSSTTVSVESLKTVPVVEVSKPASNTAATITTSSKTQNNNNTITNANGTVRVRKRHQVKVACVNCRKACKKCDENRPCARCIKMDLCSTCVDGERKPREKGVRRGPYKRQKQLQQQQNQNGTTDPKAALTAKSNDKEGLQKTRQKRKKTQKQLKQEAEAENKGVTSNSLQTTNPTATSTLQTTSLSMTNPLQADTQLLQTTLSQDSTLPLTQSTTELLNGSAPYNDLYGLYSNDNIYLNYYQPDLYYCNPLNTYPYPITENYVLPPEKVPSSLEECESLYKINTESASSPNTTNSTINTKETTNKLINLTKSSSDVLSAISSTSTMDTTEI
ncbi:hypothetical protein BCR36DRAFT_338021 [Piromyces finnis]|uniref:Zn(2)-C6 fungal-type domain-containing protein n=1 Tax=Piromyces finnis TaxID=1754191 RepID=A0A1Y1UVR8_9FUNG|nr:hypothetical protein BCR36DRAFT_338021 [Piromyces finnis]|eukprot:ORX42156.1 hypothetical protein BCR36DRAFT_338021 [Piromyces finnis]